jgi:hypothetical protein
LDESSKKLISNFRTVAVRNLAKRDKTGSRPVGFIARAFKSRDAYDPDILFGSLIGRSHPSFLI